MDKFKFCSLMSNFHDKMKENDKYYDTLEALGLMDIVEQTLEHSYASLLIEALSENSKEQEWINYLVYECDFDFEIFNEKVYINNSNLAIKSFAEFYDFIKRS